jgi:protein TonB
MATYPAFESRLTPALHPPGVLESSADRIAMAEELLDSAERAQSFTGATGAVIALRRGDQVIVRTSSGIAPEVGAGFSLDDGVVGLCVRTEKPQDCSTAAAAAGHPLLAALGVRSVAAVPVRYDGAVRAVLAVFAQNPSAFNRTHVAILMTLRDVIATNLQRAPLPLDTAPAEAVKQAPEKLAATAADAPPAVAAASAVETEAPKPAPQPAVAPTPPTLTTAQLLKLVESPPPPPIEPAPELLPPGEDPAKYKSQPAPAVTARPIGMAPAVRVAAVPRLTLATPVEAPPPPQRHTRLKAAVAFAGLVVLTAALGLYWGTRQPAAPAAAALPQPASVAAPAPAQPAAPVSMTVTAPVETPAKPAAEPRHTAAAPREETPAPAVETSAPPAIALTTGGPKPAPLAPVEAPSLSLGASATLPALPAPKAPSATLAARRSVLVASTLVQQRAPIYPEAARRLGVQGVVKLQATVGPNGRVTAVRVLSGDPMLREASVNAVRQWVYRPAMLNGDPVESTADIVLSFKKP